MPKWNMQIKRRDPNARRLTDNDPRLSIEDRWGWDIAEFHLSIDTRADFTTDGISAISLD